MNEPSRFLDPGAIQGPRLIGRLVRLLTGVLCCLVAFQAFWDFKTMLIERGVVIPNDTQWISLIIAILVLPDIIDNGFGRSWRAPVIRLSAVAWVVLGGLISLLFTRNLFGLPMIVAVDAFLLYSFGHLGISFVLASILATPGCEMRSLPQLRGRMTGQAAAVSYCPGFLTPLDRWEDSALHHREDSRRG